MKMTERFGSSSTDSGSTNNNNNSNVNNSSADCTVKHKKHKNSSKSSSITSMIVDNNNSVFIDNSLNMESSATANGQLPMEIASSSSLSTKPLKIVLKVGHSGSYSPASSNATTSFLNNNINKNNADDDHDARISSGDSSSLTLTPPELLPLNSDAFHHNVDFQQIDRINSNNRKAKKKKKKHHHHHHHHHHHQNLSLSTSNHVINDHPSQTNSIDQSKEFSTTSKMNDIVTVKNVNNKTMHITDSSATQSSLLSNSIIKNSLNIIDQTNNDSNCMEIDGHSISIKGDPYPEQINKTLSSSIRQQDSVEMIDDVDDEDVDVIMSMNQDSIFSSVDLIDVDSCSKLDISALVPDGDEMIGELNNGQTISGQEEDSRQSLNSSLSLSVDVKSLENKDVHRSHTKLKPTFSVYRQLLQKGHVRCDSNNLYEHLRRCEKMKTSLSKFRKSATSSNQIVFQNFLLSLLKRLEMKDPQKLFAWPVIDSLTPGYSQVVKHPMDFNTIRKKIEHNIYQSVAELKYDVRLLCENAIRYYRHSGMHYCEASRLWYFAKTRIFARDQLAEHLKQFPPLTISDLGMDNAKFSNIMNGTSIPATSNTPIMTNGVLSTPVKSSKTLSLQSLLNDAKCEPSIVNYRNGFDYCFDEKLVEEPTPQQILEQHQHRLQQLQTSSSSTTTVEIPALTLSRPQNTNNISICRQTEDGTTTLPFIVNDYGCDDLDNQITLGHLAGARLNEGTTSLPSYQEPETERIHPYDYLEESLKNPFGSHLPYMNSGPSTITHNDTLLLFNTFEKFEPTRHCEEIERVANDGSYLTKSYVDSLLSIVSNGEYRPSSTTPSSTETNADASNSEKFDIDNNDKNLSEKQNLKETTEEDKIQQRLKETKNLLQNLEEIQHKRLRHTTEPLEPSSIEMDVAEKVTIGLVDIIKRWFHPQDIVDSRTIHQNLGIEFNYADTDVRTDQQSTD